MTELIHLNAARQAIIQAKTVDEAKAIRDKAEALRVYAKEAGMSLEIQNDCAEIKIRAERRAGEILAEQARKQGQRDETFHHERFVPPKLKELGITEVQSHRWQLEASVPERGLAKYLAETRGGAGAVHCAVKSREGGDNHGRASPLLCG